jgi:uncharacterized membrane protein YfcA
MQMVLFLACVGVATCAQSLTGFAFGLILMGLVGVLRLAPLADAANVASVLTLVQASVVLRGSRKSIDLATLRDTALGSGIGVVIGVFLLGWLSGNVVLLLRVLLGVTILACAMVLVLRSAPLRERSSRASFRAFGLASGLMSGLFSSAGPPLVYHFYRQPMHPLAVRQTLVMIFAFNALLRLALTVPTGQFSVDAAGLSLLATPVVLGLTWLIKRHPPDWSPRRVRGLVCTLLVLAGLSLIVPVAATVPRLVHWDSPRSPAVLFMQRADLGSVLSNDLVDGFSVIEARGAFPVEQFLALAGPLPDPGRVGMRLRLLLEDPAAARGEQHAERLLRGLEFGKAQGRFRHLGLRLSLKAPIVSDEARVAALGDEHCGEIVSPQGQPVPGHRIQPGCHPFDRSRVSRRIASQLANDGQQDAFPLIHGRPGVFQRELFLLDVDHGDAP